MCPRFLYGISGVYSDRTLVALPFTARMGLHWSVSHQLKAEGPSGNVFCCVEGLLHELFPEVRGRIETCRAQPVIRHQNPRPQLFKSVAWLA